MAFSQTLRCLTYKAYYFLILLSLISCFKNNNETVTHIVPTEYDVIHKYFLERQNYSISNSDKTIFVLTDVGCMPCNKHFSELISDNLNDSTSIFLILANGSNLDLSLFNKKNKKVFFDKQENIKNDILKKSKAIFLEQSKVDTSIVIDARQIEIQFKEIRNHLSKKM